MNNKQGANVLLKKVNNLEREIEELKRDIIRNLSLKVKKQKIIKRTLFGSVRGGDVTIQMIDEAKRRVLRDIDDT